MGQPLQLLTFSARPAKPTYSNTSHLPSSTLAMLSDIVERFDLMLLHQPENAATVLKWADRMLRIFNG